MLPQLLVSACSPGSASELPLLEPAFGLGEMVVMEAGISPPHHRQPLMSDGGQKMPQRCGNQEIRFSSLHYDCISPVLK